MMAAEGRMYDGKEMGVEFGINAATFLVGGAIFKVGKIIQGEAKLLSKAGMGAFAVTGTGDVAIGTFSEQARAKYKNIGISWTQSIENSLLWALAPLAFRGTSVTWNKISLARRQVAERAQQGLERAEALKAL